MPDIRISVGNAARHRASWSLESALQCPLSHPTGDIHALPLISQAVQDNLSKDI